VREPTDKTGFLVASFGENKPVNICELLDIGKSELNRTEEPSTRESKTHICELLNIPFIYPNNNILPQCNQRGLKARNATISRMNQMKCIMRVGDLAYALYYQL
jgi:hypothetical protein